jgi:anthraniloyl-CoA monooxygenase
MDLPSEQFAFQILTRSQRITYDNLFLRDSEFAKEILGWFHRAQPSDIRPDNPNTPPMFYPFQLRSLRLKNRVVVSPMAQYCSVDGMPNDWHLVHLGSRAVGGAALVMTEMTCVSPEGRITPGCTGLWSSKQADEWSRIVTFVHDQTQSLIGMQLGHSGRKGSTRVAWQGMDLPLESENWSLLAPSAVPYLAESVVPKAMTRNDMDLVRDQFVRSTKLATQAKFDLLEVHAAHGYLLSSFLSPITNKREDEYGGSLENRMRYPLEVISCVRAAWPDHLPLSVRISATDWIDGGFDGNQATQFARQLQQIGVDIIDVSTGEVDRAQQPAYGRLYQTPFADRIRQEVGIPTMTVGGVSSVDDVNTIILAGRADLCLMARPHLVDPYWTLNAAIDQGYEEIEWPRQYLSGKTARRRDQSAI